MEKRITRKVDIYIAGFKNDIRNRVLSMDIDKFHLNELLEYVNEYESLILQKDDFIKRKRVKNAIPQLNRCNAKRANGEQCTRRRRDDCEFCGTHYKGTPHGLVTSEDGLSKECSKQSIEVIVEDICGIAYYLDKYGNVYKTEDVMKGIDNPRIIAKYVEDYDGPNSLKFRNGAIVFTA